MWCSTKWCSMYPLGFVWSILVFSGVFWCFLALPNDESDDTMADHGGHENNNNDDAVSNNGKVNTMRRTMTMMATTTASKGTPQKEDNEGDTSCDNPDHSGKHNDTANGGNDKKRDRKRNTMSRSSAEAVPKQNLRKT